jgi:hypothetical protein
MRDKWDVTYNGLSPYERIVQRKTVVKIGIPRSYKHHSIATSVPSLSIVMEKFGRQHMQCHLFFGGLLHKINLQSDLLFGKDKVGCVLTARRSFASASSTSTAAGPLVALISLEAALA